MSQKNTAKALKAAKAARVGANEKKVKVYTKVHFYKPKTLVLPREPKYLTSTPSHRGTKFDVFTIIKKVSAYRVAYILRPLCHSQDNKRITGITDCIQSCSNTIIILFAAPYHCFCHEES